MVTSQKAIFSHRAKISRIFAGSLDIAIIPQKCVCFHWREDQQSMQGPISLIAIAHLTIEVYICTFGVFAVSILIFLVLPVSPEYLLHFNAKKCKRKLGRCSLRFRFRANEQHALQSSETKPADLVPAWAVLDSKLVSLV